MMLPHLFVLVLCFLCWSNGSSGQVSSTKAYIVYLGGKRGVEAETLTLTHHDMLARVTGSMETAPEAMIYSYKHAFNGFSARLTEDQANSISRMPEVLNVFPSRMLQLHTTRSWDFLGLTESQYALPHIHRSNGSYDVIIGLLDTGIWPESQSFKDTGMGPVPARWKGACVNSPETNASQAVSCNRKIIGARYYAAGVYPNDTVIKSARDDNGHGTHTSSTAAGSLVPNASMRGLANGTARGGAPYARLAMYKVCWGIGCSDVDMLAAFDDAIHDGVDVLSISIGGVPVNYSVDSIAIGAYHAIERGILVACGAGNLNIWTTQVLNAAPWILTVGASTIDRKIVDSRTIIPFKPAPVMAGFSLAGPNIISLDIIKPDITAPGVDILAAWPSNIPVYDHKGGMLYTDYAFLSGTSMSTPHAAAALAYLKAIYPSWSPAAIKSALMTTATTLDNTNKTIGYESGSPAGAFNFGSGEIQPVKAVDPGLVYDTLPVEYLIYLCNAGYTWKQIQNITGDSNSECPENNTAVSLNYPSIGFNQLVDTHTIWRTVTNVGPPISVYTASVTPASDKALSITVNPNKLSFTSTGQKLTYSVTLSASRNASSASAAAPQWVFSALTWADGIHRVRSPIAVSI